VKAIALSFVLMIAAAVGGCGNSSESQNASVELRVIAEPKNGVHEVTAYDPPAVRAAASGQFEHVDYSHLPDIIVWLVPAIRTSADLPAFMAIDVDPTKPTEEIVPATVGQKIVYHNVTAKPLALYSVSDGNEFDIKIAPDATGEASVRGEGLVEVLADPAQPPVIRLYVASTRWVKRVHSGEKVSFDHLSAGQYQAFAWHPRLPGSSIALDLKKGEIAHGTIKVGVNSLQPASSP